MAAWPPQTDDHELIVWNTNTWQAAVTFLDLDAPIAAIEELADGSLVTGDEDGAVHRWDLTEPQPVTIATTHRAPIIHIEVIQGDRILVNTVPGLTLILDTSEPQAPLRELLVTAAAADPEHGRAVVAELDNTLRSWGGNNETTEIVGFPFAISQIQVYDSNRLAVATGKNVVVVDITD